MNLKLALQLSLTGLLMAFCTVSLIPEKLEFFFWISIFINNARVIAKKSSSHYFLNGFIVSLFNSVWITGVHVLFYQSYALHHPDMASMSNNMGYFSTHPRQFMLITSPVFGIIFGIFQGLFAFIAAKLFKKKAVLQTAG